VLCDDLDSWLCDSSPSTSWRLLVYNLFAPQPRHLRPTHCAVGNALQRRIEHATAVVLCHARVQAPFVCGLFHPAIVLPADYATAFDAPALHAVLLHECAHLARRDCWWKVFASAACAILWMQPLLWMLCRRLEQISESFMR
jgi:beta-lactamase regulating signal transducer with metallopeptidase domain